MTIQQLEDIAVREFQNFWGSKTVKLLLATEAGAASAFALRLATGEVPMTKEELAKWACAQVAILWGLFKRHTDAGIEAKQDVLLGAIVHAGEAAVEKAVGDKVPQLGAAIAAEQKSTSEAPITK